MRVGNYTLLDLLGRGGTSEVYAAEDALGEPVAVKVLRPALVLDAATVSAFIAEGVRTRDLAHPSVVRVLDVGSDAATGSCYLVMERIVGESLATRLARQGRLDEPTLRALAAEVADGMHAAHARGVVHRDLKPGNIMLRARGVGPRDLEPGNAPVIIDFGIAKSLGASSAVVTERRIGTLAYMAPEQLADGLITPAADIWALGVILFEAATGQLPFASFSGGKLPQLVETAPRAATLAPISPALDDLIARCLDRDPGKRPSSMAEIASVLRGNTDERITEDVGARVLASSHAAAPLRRRRWPVIAIVAAAATAGGALLALATTDRSTSAPPDAGAPSAIAPPPSPAPIPDAAVDVIAVEAPEPIEVEPPALVEEPARAKTERTRKRTTKRTKAREERATKPREKRTTSQGETLD